MIRLIAILFASICFTSYSQVNTGMLRGKISDIKTGEPIFSATILIYDSTTRIAGAKSDFDGLYTIKNIQPGNYRVVIQNMEYEEQTVEGVLLEADKVTFLDIELDRGEILIEAVQVQAYKVEAKKLSSRNIGRLPVRGSRASDKFNRESYSHIQDNTYVKVKNDPLSTFSIDVDRASYSNVRRYIQDGSLPPKDAVRIEEMINYFSYEYAEPDGDDPFSITTEYTTCPWNVKHKLVHVGIKGEEVDMESAPANNLVFLIDVSGSMSSPDKLDLLKSGLYLLVDQLRKEDRVAIVVYAGAAGLVLPSTSGDNKDRIKSVIEQLNAGGSTAGGAGIELAYKTAQENFIKNGNNRVILATDGDFNVGVSSEGDLVRLIEEKREHDIFLTVLGFGRGNLQDSKMEKLADKGNGNYNYIDNILEAKKVLISELGGTLITIAKDVKIQVEFNPKHVKAYRLIGYENRQLEDEDFNNDKKDAGELGSGHTVTVLYEIIPAGSDENLQEVDSLKYQQEHEQKDNESYSDEVLTVKFRYKEPKGVKSKLITRVLMDDNIPFNQASNDLKFAAAVASFGMLLRDSEFKGESSYDSVIEMAKNAKGLDADGYRAEFIRLVEMAALLKR